LGYTPANKAGDTFTGALTLQSTLTLPNTTVVSSTTISGGGSVLKLGAGGTVGLGNSVWTNEGARLIQLMDRVAVGAATASYLGDVPPGTVGGSSATWLDNIAPFPTQNSQFYSLSTIGNFAIVGASRASDASSGANPIGIGGYGINDVTASAQPA